MTELLNQIKWDKDGLVSAIAQDARTQRVLMVAYMNAESLQRTIETGFAHYFSRSRQKQWKKGEESGHFQRVLELRTDCDGDAVIMQIEQEGGIACHTGRKSCFFRRWNGCTWEIVDDVLKDEIVIYGKIHE